MVRVIRDQDIDDPTIEEYVHFPTPGRLAPSVPVVAQDQAQPVAQSVAQAQNIESVPVTDSVAQVQNFDRVPSPSPVAQSPIMPPVTVTQPVAQSRVSLVAQRSNRRSCATSGTLALRSAKINNLPKGKSHTVPPPKIAGHEWRQAGAGWSLWRRVPTISATGKRTSERKYVRYITQSAIERIYNRNGKSKPQTKS